MNQDAGIKRPATRRHRNAVERRETHAGVPTDAGLQSTKAGAAAQMRHDDAATSDVRRDPLQLRDDELIGKAMEAVALDALIEQRPRQSEAAHEVALAAVERRIE